MRLYNVAVYKDPTKAPVSVQEVARDSYEAALQAARDRSDVLTQQDMLPGEPGTRPEGLPPNPFTWMSKLTGNVYEVTSTW